MAVMEKYSSTLTASDLIDSDLPAVLAGIPVKLGEYQVQAGEELAIGYGPFAGQSDAIGRVYMQFKDDTATPVLEPGLVRLSVWSPQNRPLVVLGEWRTEALNTSATDRTQQLPLSENQVNIREDQKLVLEFISDAADILTKSACTIALDVTRYVVR
ncbi:hypothetical protein [Dehalobacter restrictus]|uniref:hypothetical protein n=1 Tax=Dehalobacter restrictus TaxID=55583 RepID=UPI00338F5BA5